MAFFLVVYYLILLHLETPYCSGFKKERAGHLAEHQNLDFGWGNDLGIVGSIPVLGSMLRGESAGDSLSFYPLAPLPTHVHSLFFSQSK